MSQKRVQTLLITGLAGAGKSRFVSSLVRSLDHGKARCAVCVHRHARAFGLETTELPLELCAHYAEVYDFGSGCLCCSPDGDLSRLLTELEQLQLTHLLIETTGAADPRPFIKLFQDPEGLFQLLGVVSVVDVLRAGELLQGAAAAASNSTAGRGATQLRCSQVVVLNRVEDLSVKAQAAADEQLAAVKKVVTELASGGHRAQAEALAHAPVVLVPAPSGTCAWSDLTESLANTRGMYAGSCRSCDEEQAEVPLSGFTMSFGPLGHDASCETACLVVPHGGVRLDAALAMLQAMLDGGEAFRIQGYLSFWPAGLEPGASAQFPPPLCLSWGLPCVMIQGVYRGQLEVHAVQAAELPGRAAQLAEESQRPWQETAMAAAAGDRGGCKVFICGRRLEEKELKRQLAGTLRLGFQGPIANLEQLSAEAARAAAHSQDATAEAVKAALVKSSPPASVQIQGSRGLAEERSRAEAFAAQLVAKVEGFRGPPASAKSMQVEIPFSLSQGGAPQLLLLDWRDGQVAVRRHKEVPAPFTGGGSQLRFCAPGGSGDEEESFQVLVLRSEVYIRAQTAKVSI